MRAVGDSRRPLLYLLVCCVMNIILDIVMVVGMKMGIAGAALATVISQCVSAILVTWSLTRAYDAMKLKFRELRMDARVLKKRIEDRCSGSASGMCIRCDECGAPGIGQQLWYGYRCWMGSLWKA